VTFREHGLLFEADVVHGQKTGHFLDQRDNRERVRNLADGARVLDVFSCTGGFSVYAAAGGATAVTSVDQSEPALVTARRNMGRSVDNCHLRQPGALRLVPQVLPGLSRRRASRAGSVRSPRIEQ